MDKSNIRNMKRPDYPYLLCMNEGCDFHVAPIPLPPESPPARVLDRQKWPKALWREVFACPIHGHIHVYTTLDVHWSDQLPVDEKDELRLDWFSVPIRCELAGCEVETLLRIPTPAGTCDIAGLSLLLSTKARFSGKLYCEHDFVPQKVGNYAVTACWAEVE